MYPASTGPQYVPGGSANSVICLVVALLALALRYIHKWENKKLERLETETETAEAGGESTAVSGGPTQDRRAAGFRYVY